MDDQFLHRLRREPPAAFATRLKWQLDRPVPTRRLGSRLILGLAICGTAFALVFPPSRHLLAGWFATPGIPISTAPQKNPLPASSPARPAGLPGQSSGRRAPQQAYVVPVPADTAPQIAPAPVPPQVEAPATDAPSVATPPVAPVIVGGVPQTPEMRALSAVTVRQGLFLNLGFVMQSLSTMLQRGGPPDMGVVRTNAIRLQTLSSMIPEVFQTDTHTFGINTRAVEGIWRNPQQFAAMAGDLTLATDALASAAASNDEIAAARAMIRVEMACTACHDVFRAK